MKRGDIVGSCQWLRRLSNAVSWRGIVITAMIVRTTRGGAAMLTQLRNKPTNRSVFHQRQQLLGESSDWAQHEMAKINISENATEPVSGLDFSKNRSLAGELWCPFLLNANVPSR